MLAPGKPFKLSKMFVGKAGAYPSEAPVIAPLWGSFPLPKKLARDKHSSLLRNLLIMDKKVL
jgi:hypothetical protein